MIGHTGLLEYHPCPLGALCSRAYCPFMHESVSRDQQSSQSPSSNNLVISQEDNNFQGGGYVGYVGTDRGYNGSSMPTTSYHQPMYVQEPGAAASSYSQQINYQQMIGQYGQWQPTNQYRAYHQPMDQLYGHSALQPQVSLYAPEDPVTFSSASSGVPLAVDNSVYRQTTIPGDSGLRSYSSMHRQRPQSNVVPSSSNVLDVPKEKEAVVKERFLPRVREQFSPLADAVAINPKKIQGNIAKKKKVETINFEKRNAVRSNKRKIAEQVQQYQKNINNHASDFDKDEQAEKHVIDDILSTASHVCLPLSTEPVSKKKPLLNSHSVKAMKKPVNLRKSTSNELPLVKATVPLKEVIPKQISIKDTSQLEKNREVVFETKAAPASALALRTKHQRETLRHIESGGPESSVEFVPLPAGTTVDLTDNAEMRGNSQINNKAQIEVSKAVVNAAKIKGKPDVLNANIKAITKIDEEIEKLGRDLLSKETKKIPVCKQEKSARDAAKKWNIADAKPKNLPVPSSGALHNPNFDINSLFDDDEIVESSKICKGSSADAGKFQDSSGKNSVASDAVSKPLKSHSLIGVPKQIPSAAEQMRKRFSSSASSSNVGSNPVNMYKMFNKGGPRTARPGSSVNPGKALAPLDPHNRKLSYAVRFKYLQKLRDEILSAVGCSEDEAVDKAIYQEKDILDRVSSKIGYGGAIATAIKQIRESLNGPAVPTNEGISHNDVLAGRHVKNISMAVKRSKRDDKSHIGEANFYLALQDRYLMSKEQLYENGYPIWVDDSTKRLVAIKSSGDCARRERYVADENLKRICSRCGFEYRLTKDAKYAAEAECVYHWGKAWKKRINGAVDTRYNCCDQDLTIKGCTVGDCHITDTIRQSTLHQYVETPKPVGAGDPRSNKVYAMDCEMVYGVWGSQIARISVVDLLDELVLDEFVRPEVNNPVVDCNTRFSGLTKEQIENAKYDLRGVQELLFQLVNAETILIGHSLESDLKALRIVHTKVVDTSVVFPHRLGPPKKRALKTLTSEFLQKIIQEEESGHDSKEDASACMKLMYHKVKTDGAA